MLTEEADHTITLHPKWNYIGYTLMANLPINEALADLKDKASDGDIIKSQDEFATFAFLRFSSEVTPSLLHRYSIVSME